MAVDRLQFALFREWQLGLQGRSQYPDSACKARERPFERVEVHAHLRPRWYRPRAYPDVDGHRAAHDFHL